MIPASSIIEPSKSSAALSTSHFAWNMLCVVKMTKRDINVFTPLTLLNIYGSKINNQSNRKLFTKFNASHIDFGFFDSLVNLSSELKYNNGRLKKVKDLAERFRFPAFGR